MMPKLSFCFPLLLMMIAGSAMAGREPEPNVKIAKTWWEDQRNVWTPIGWQEHYFRFNVLYNGTVLFEPASPWTSRTHAEQWRGRDFQLTFTPSPDGKPRPLPSERVQLWKLDGGHGVQGWNREFETPVLWTDYPLQEGLVIRQEVFANVRGSGPVETALEPIYAWIRLTVRHVDDERAPAEFPMAVQMSRNFHDHNQRYLHEDGITVDVDPSRAPYPNELRAEPFEVGEEIGLRVLEPSGDVRLVVLPTDRGRVNFSELDSGLYNLAVNMRGVVGDQVDILFPALPQPNEEINREMKLGFDGALAEAERFWEQRPDTAARFLVPESFITEAIEQSVKFARVISEKDYVTGDYSMLSGSWGYDQLWSTPTSMNSHMFLSLLGEHEFVARHSELFREHQGTVKPPGPSYEVHPGYFSTPETLTSFDWLSDHGAILLQISTEALMSGDEEFIRRWIDPIVKACDFIKDSSARTDHEGVKGLLPPAVATDEIIPTQAVWNMAWNYRGLVTAIRLLKRVEHPRAEEFEEFAADFKSTFRQAFRELSAEAPRWTDGDGNRRIRPPTTLSTEPMPWHPFSDAFYLDTGPMVLVWAGLMDADDELMRSSVDYFRNGPNHELLGTRCHPLCRPTLRREISSCEPCYSWNVFHSWQLGDRRHFLEGMYSLFVGSLSQQTYIACEHRHGMQGNLFSTGTAFTLARLAMIDDTIVPGELHLLRLVPQAWISSKEETILENMPTEYGPVNLRFQKSPDGETLHVSLSGNWRHLPASIILHSPPVPSLKYIEVNGTRRSAEGTIELAEPAL